MATTRSFVRRTVRVLSAVTAVAQTLPAHGSARAIVDAATIALTVAELGWPWIDREWLVPATRTTSAYRATNTASSACTS